MFKKAAMLLLFAVAGLLAAACGSGGGPASHSIDLEINDRALAGQDVIQVKKGDSVSLNWTVDEPVTIHLHGYDIEKVISPGAGAVFEFTANIEGRFVMEAHSFGASQEPAVAEEQAEDHHDDEGDEEGDGPPAESDDSEGEEVTLGYLEVGPR